MKLRKNVLAVVASLGISGCMSMSGYDASSQFACKAPDVVLCESMSGIYANAEAHNLPGQRGHRAVPARDVRPTASNTQYQAVMTTPIYSGTPIRSAPKVLRVWFAPWEDSDGDLHDQSYLYLPVDGGRWLIEHNRRRIREAYQPVRPPANWGKPGTPSVRGDGTPMAPSASMGGTPSSWPPQGASTGESSDGGVNQHAMSPDQVERLMSGVARPGEVLPGNR